MRPVRSRTGTRSKNRASQLQLWQGSVAGGPDLQPTRVLLAHRSCARVLELIRQVRTFFPELDGLTLKVGLTRRAAGLASREEPWIWVNPLRLTRHTVAHEMVHLLQAKGLAPAGEKSADLYALARHPLLADDLPCYLVTPKKLRSTWQEESKTLPSLLHRIACESLVRRAAGERNYLQWFERELARRWSDPGARAPERVPVQASLF
jgi:hypothetical protein